ncbi:hypothetical protein [Streptomyces johnsoniae]|uniref:HSP-70 cofactor n=1 Tax=Streptomyces johnsoniae TaxID=3075532 RepID=A0ABU2SG63_9ACTN|nr:hypothetical protein [Streptomyces sp. DSM 41886]MDT0447080.1 hypothetical protein [Streptomyces sp. DSM 41886]
MSSSAEESGAHEPLDWDDFAERPAPREAAGRDGGDLPPDRELAAVLQRFWSDVAEERNKAHAEAAGTREAAVELAIHVARLESLLAEAVEPLEAAGKRNLGRRLAVVCKQMQTQLAQIGVEATDPTGEPFDAVADEVDVLRWRHGAQYPAEVVAETLEPVVRDRGVVVRLAQVVMGAPAPAMPPAPATATPPAAAPDQPAGSTQDTQREQQE